MRFLFKASRLFLPAITLLLFGGGCAPAKKDQAMDSAMTAVSPIWHLTSLDGRELSSSSLKGMVVVLDFWATWCGPCLTEIPGYIELQNKYGKDGLVIIGASLDQRGPAHVKEFAVKKGINYALAMADAETVEAFGGFNAIPTTFLINREGVIVHTKTGAMDPAAYEALVKTAL